MKTRLFYFSATGNCLSVAKKIQDKLQVPELISIPQVKENEAIQGGCIGIVTPVYMHNIPHIVVNFIKKIQHADYIFIVFAGGGQLGTGIKKTRKLFKKQGLELSALFNVAMPSNYTPYGCPSNQLQEELFKKADGHIDALIDVISMKKTHFDKNNTDFFKAYIHPGMVYQLGYKFINTLDKDFSVDETCNSCSICEQVCPVNNITIKNGYPVWSRNCQQCFACLQWCPKQSIQYGKRTKGVRRYHHPKVKVGEIINSSKQT